MTATVLTYYECRNRALLELKAVVKCDLLKSPENILSLHTSVLQRPTSTAVFGEMPPSPSRFVVRYLITSPIVKITFF